MIKTKLTGLEEAARALDRMMAERVERIAPAHANVAWPEPRIFAPGAELPPNMRSALAAAPIFPVDPFPEPHVGFAFPSLADFKD